MCDNKQLLVLTTVPPQMGLLVISTKTKAGLVTEDDPLPFRVTPWQSGMTPLQSLQLWHGACSPAACGHLPMLVALTGRLMEEMSTVGAVGSVRYSDKARPCLRHMHGRAWNLNHWHASQCQTYPPNFIPVGWFLLGAAICATILLMVSVYTHNALQVLDLHVCISSTRINVSMYVFHSCETFFTRLNKKAFFSL